MLTDFHGNEAKTFFSHQAVRRKDNLLLKIQFYLFFSPVLAYFGPPDDHID
jgi:hypothetical protein